MDNKQKNLVKKIASACDLLDVLLPALKEIEKSGNKLKNELHKKQFSQEIISEPVLNPKKLDALDRVIKLDAVLKDQFEYAFGADFHDVKIHVGAYAEKKARMSNADAVTIGNDIYFAGGKYSPDTEEGIRLLAHELQHVVQYKNSERMRYNEDIEQLEHKAEKVEDLMSNLGLHNIKEPVLSQTSVPKVDVDKINEDFVEARNSNTFRIENSNSLEDFANRNDRQVMELALSTGHKVKMSPATYHNLIKKAKDEIKSWVRDKESEMTEDDYNKFILKFIKWTDQEF